MRRNFRPPRHEIKGEFPAFSSQRTGPARIIRNAGFGRFPPSLSLICQGTQGKPPTRFGRVTRRPRPIVGMAWWAALDYPVFPWSRRCGPYRRCPPRYPETTPKQAVENPRHKKTTSLVQTGGNVDPWKVGVANGGAYAASLALTSSQILPKTSGSSMARLESALRSSWIPASLAPWINWL